MFRLTSGWLKTAALPTAMAILALLSTQAQGSYCGTNYPDSHFCQDIYDATMCSYMTPNVTSCSTSDRIGTCTYQSSSSAIQFYSGYPLSTAQQVCADTNGVWSTTGATTPTASTPLPPPPANQSAYTAANGKMPSAAVQVNATGTYGSASLKVNLNVATVLKTARSSFAAASYNVYVFAIIPGALLGSASPAVIVKPKAPGNWGLLQWPIASFMENVTQSAVNDQVLVEILSDANILALVGTEFYIGYGTSGQEMLEASRYRGVFKIQ